MLSIYHWKHVGKCGFIIKRMAAHTPGNRVGAIKRTLLGCYENLIRSDLYIYPSRRSAHLFLYLPI